MSSTSVEHQHRSDEEQPLLRHRRKPESPSLNVQHWYANPLQGERWTVQNARQKTTRFLSSKTGHYSVLTLVSLDVLGMIAGKSYSTQLIRGQLIRVDFILNLFKCERGKSGPDWDLALDILGSISLVFSCLFMVELLASIWAFGWKYDLPTCLILTESRF